MLTAEERKRHLTIIQNDDTRAAFHHLVEQTAHHGLVLSGNTGEVAAVRLHDEAGRYLFSWITNQNHLLFYIRKPALKVARQLAPDASADLTKVNENPKGETTVRIEGKADAQKLTEWLMPRLPLPH